MEQEILIKRKSTEPNVLLERQEMQINNVNTYVLTDPSYYLLCIIDGVLQEDFPEGKHCIITKVNTGIFSKKKISKKDIAVIYIAKDYKVRTFWGTNSKFDFKDPCTQVVIQIGANGEGEISIANARTFFRQVVAARKTYSKEDLEEFVRSRLVLHINDIISKVLIDEKITYYDFVTKQLEISNKVFERVKSIFLEDYGLILSSFTLSEIFVSDEDKKRINDAEASVKQREEQEKESLKKKQEEKEKELRAEKEKEEAKKDAKEIAKELERLSDKEWERNLILKQLEQSDYQKYLDVMKIINIAQSNAKATINAQNRNEEEVKQAICLVCGEKLDKNSRFCAKCGTAVSGFKIKCPHCSAQIDSGSKFCSNCGKKIKD